MRGSRIAAFFVAAVWLFSVAAPVGAQNRENLNSIKEGGQVAPFKGRNLDGEEIDVGALIGKKVVVIAFWSIYCKPCVEEISSLIRLQDEFGGDDLEVIGINTDSELGIGRIRTFINRFESFEKKTINYENIYDEDNAISKLLGIGFLPTVLSVDAQGKVVKVFVGFEEKSEQEIFADIRSLLPSVAPTPPDTDSLTFSVEAVVPLCGFYNADGWIGNFTGNRDLDAELEKTAEMARSKATKMVLKEALLSLGINLAEDPEKDNCFRPYGVYILEDPLEIKDNLTNLIQRLPANRLVRSQESSEDFLETEYRVSERATVNMVLLRDQLDTLGYDISPRTVSFSVVNVRKLDQVIFEKVLLQQSQYIGYFSFPNFTIYTTVENFAEEVGKMDLEGLRIFIEDAGDDRIELEVWQ
jgi:thiol-disulfide isomerase/thioredoxin